MKGLFDYMVTNCCSRERGKFVKRNDKNTETLFTFFNIYLFDFQESCFLSRLQGEKKLFLVKDIIKTSVFYAYIVFTGPAEHQSGRGAKVFTIG